MGLWRDIGNGVEMSLARCMNGDEPCIVLLKHEHNGEPEMAASLPLPKPCRAGEKESWWQITQADPLTLNPSISAPCGLHGWIRNGRWETAG